MNKIWCAICFFLLYHSTQTVIWIFPTDFITALTVLLFIDEVVDNFSSEPMVLIILVNFLRSKFMQEVESFELMFLKKNLQSILQKFQSSLEIDHIHHFLDWRSDSISFLCQLPVGSAVARTEKRVDWLFYEAKEAKRLSIFVLEVTFSIEHFVEDSAIDLHEAKGSQQGAE